MINPSTQSKSKLPVICQAYKQYCKSINNHLYLDFIGANNTVILGYKIYQFSYCPNFSGKSFLEDKVSDLLSEYTKTSFFRYFKNGSDAVSCAIRLARHICKNGRAKIGFIGYGGAVNEYVYTINKNGTYPCESVQINPDLLDIHNSYMHPFDVLVFESRYSDIARSINANFKVCDHLKSGILGLDEETFDFDLYGKSIANGYPVSIMTGKDNLMKKIDEIYYSTTFGGDNVGLEAITKTINEFSRKKEEYLALLEYAKKKLPEWKTITDNQVEQFLEKGVLFNGYWQLMTCHTKEEVNRLASLCDAIM